MFLFHFFYNQNYLIFICVSLKQVLHVHIWLKYSPLLSIRNEILEDIGYPPLDNFCKGTQFKKNERALENFISSLNFPSKTATIFLLGISLISQCRSNARLPDWTKNILEWFHFQIGQPSGLVCSKRRTRTHTLWYCSRSPQPPRIRRM